MHLPTILIASTKEGAGYIDSIKKELFGLAECAVNGPYLSGSQDETLELHAKKDIPVIIYVLSPGDSIREKNNHTPLFSGNGVSDSSINSQLKKDISDNDIIPMKYLYCTDTGYKYWSELCRRPEYTFYTHSKELLLTCIDELSELLLPGLKGENIDVVSLGTGDGAKDAIILRAIRSEMTRSKMLCYYPVEISLPMMMMVIKGLLPDISAATIRVRAILGDFNLLTSYKRICRESEPKIFLLLGNSIGNSDEALLLDSLNKSMQAGDYLLIEANTEKGFLGEITEIYKQHDFSPLQSLGIKYESGNMEYTIVRNLSEIPNTASILATYKSAVIDKDIVSDIKLSVVHHYDQASFIQYFRDKHGLENIKAWSYKNVSSFLFRKE